MGWQTNPVRPVRVDAADIAMANVTTSIKWPVVETVDPEPIDPRRDTYEQTLAPDASYGVVRRVLFYSPICCADVVDHMRTNLQRAHELSPPYTL